LQILFAAYGTRQTAVEARPLDRKVRPLMLLARENIDAILSRNPSNTHVLSLHIPACRGKEKLVHFIPIFYLARGATGDAPNRQRSLGAVQDR
jgi:hypothetical protein